MLATGQTVYLTFVGIFIFLTAIGLLKGFGRGAGRQTVRAVTIAISAIAALMIANGISTELATMCEGKTTEEILIMLDLHTMLDEEMLNLLACFDAVTAERLIELPLLVILMPFIFTLCFIAISAVMLIIHAILCAIFRLNGKGSGVFSRLIGTVIGTLQGAAVAIIFLLPVINIVGIAADTNANVLENHPDDADEVEFCVIYDEYVKETYESQLFQISYNVIGDALCDKFATIDIDDTPTNLRDTTSRILVAADDFMALGEFNWTAPSDDECAALENIISELSRDTYVASILSGSMRGLAIAIDTGVLVFDLEEPVLGVMNSLMSIFTTINEENFAGDVDTILDVYFLLAKEGVLDSLQNDPDNMSAVFATEDENGETVIKRIIATIQSNPHLSPLVTMLTKLSMSIMMQDVGIENGEEVYETVKEGITNVIAIDKTQYETNEEYVSAVSEALDSTLKENNIEVAPEIVDYMAEYISTQDYSNLSKDEITDDDVNDVIFSYYDAYLKYINEGGENPFPGVLPDAGEEGGEGGDVTEGGDVVEGGDATEGGDVTEETKPNNNSNSGVWLPID